LNEKAQSVGDACAFSTITCSRNGDRIVLSVQVADPKGRVGVLHPSAGYADGASAGVGDVPLAAGTTIAREVGEIIITGSRALGGGARGGGVDLLALVHMALDRRGDDAQSSVDAIRISVSDSDLVAPAVLGVAASGYPVEADLSAAAVAAVAERFRAKWLSGSRPTAAVVSLTLENCRVAQGLGGAAPDAVPHPWLSAVLAVVKGKLRIAGNASDVALLRALPATISATSVAFENLVAGPPRRPRADGAADEAFSAVVSDKLCTSNSNGGVSMPAVTSFTSRWLNIGCVPVGLKPSQMKQIVLQGAGLVGPFPVDIAEYQNLTTLHLDNNSITELPSAALLESHTALTSLRVPANQLRGSLNTKRLPRQLVELVLSHNQLSGPISIADLPRGIATFDIAFNEFTGPVDLTAFRAALRFAFLQHNRFTGRYDVTRLPLLSVKIVFGENDWDSLLPVVTDEELAEGDL
jgi:hypothetical protein